MIIKRTEAQQKELKKRMEALKKKVKAEMDKIKFKITKRKKPLGGLPGGFKKLHRTQAEICSSINPDTVH